MVRAVGQVSHNILLVNSNYVTKAQRNYLFNASLNCLMESELAEEPFYQESQSFQHNQVVVFFYGCRISQHSQLLGETQTGYRTQSVQLICLHCTKEQE